MDSFSQWTPNLNDDVQQSHWINETNKLWSEATSRNETFDFKTIDDVLEENALCKEENNRLNDIISEDIKQLKDNITFLDNAISDVNDEVTSLSSTVSDVSDAVESNSDEILHNNERISSVSSTVTLNTKHIDDNCESIMSNTDSITNVAASLKDEISNASNVLSDEISTLTESISDVNSKVEDNSAKITSVSENVASLTEDVASLTSSDEKQEIKIEDNIQRLDTLSTRGRWCGYQDGWSADNSIITYDSYFFTDTNMNVSVTPLDITTGNIFTSNCITLLLTCHCRRLHCAHDRDL